ncbi:MAG: electron transfer flavoprotein subunit alpha/FixB family protein [Sphaerochaetaceae bacterium]|nr:electron transfer flavoprotein subunit alpha/FixB family protein [Sphaerochaetaceae bacterium]
MHDVWILAETGHNGLKDISFELLARGRALADTLGVKLAAVVIGGGLESSEAWRLIAHGSDIVYVVQDSRLEHVTCIPYSRVIEHLIRKHSPQILLAGATTTGRTILPYVAVKVHSGLTADCTDLAIEADTGNLLQTRPAIGGNIMATIKTPDHRPQMATVRPRSCRPLKADPSRSGQVVSELFETAWDDDRFSVEDIRVPEGDRVSIEEADIVVSGGRGLKKKENVVLLDRLAHLLSGETGASREAVDRGWKSYPHQVGLSGKTISPKLYIGVGISGAVQHLAGIKTAECIVAINSDEEANLVAMADFALIGDLFEILPEIQRQIEERRRSS